MTFHARYRYSVDEQGRLVDMVALVRSHLPSRFDRARPASAAASPQGLQARTAPVAAASSAAAELKATRISADADGDLNSGALDAGAAAAGDGNDGAGSLAGQPMLPRGGRYLPDPSAIADRQQRQDAYLDDGAAAVFPATGAAGSRGGGGEGGGGVTVSAQQQGGSMRVGRGLEAELIPAGVAGG